MEPPEAMVSSPVPSSSLPSTAPRHRFPSTRVSFHHLPDPLHDLLASFLTTKDTLSLMEADTWLLQACGSRVNQVALCCRPFDNEDSPRITSLIKRRPNLMHLAIRSFYFSATALGVGQAMVMGHCRKLMSLMLRVRDVPGLPQGLASLSYALVHGASPHLSRLVIEAETPADVDRVMLSLGQAFRRRMDKPGCCGVRSLEVRPPLGSNRAITLSQLGPMLSCGACDGLEELKLDSLSLTEKAKEALNDWFLRVRGSQLRVLTTRYTTPVMASVIISQGFALHLQSLHLGSTLSYYFPEIAEVIAGGAWPDLREFEIKAASDGRNDDDMEKVVGLVRAFHLAAPELRVLIIKGGMDEGEDRLVFQELLDGACPLLEVLDLSHSWVDNDGIEELATVMEGGAPCNTSLRRLSLGDCCIGSHGLEHFAAAIGRGILPNLEYLDVSGSEEVWGEEEMVGEGVVALARAMEGGALPRLQELVLDHLVIGDEGIEVLCQAFRNGACHELKRLGLRGPGISRSMSRLLIQTLSDRVKVDMTVEEEDEEEEEEEGSEEEGEESEEEEDDEGSDDGSEEEEDGMDDDDYDPMWL